MMIIIYFFEVKLCFILHLFMIMNKLNKRSTKVKTRRKEYLIKYYFKEKCILIAFSMIFFWFCET